MLEGAGAQPIHLSSVWLLWPPEMTCSALHLQGHGVARAPAGEGSTEGRQRCRDKGWPTEGEGGQSHHGLSSPC